jgi:hypothetical protein
MTSECTYLVLDIILERILQKVLKLQSYEHVFNMIVLMDPSEVLKLQSYECVQSDTFDTLLVL